jgi:putative oxidoreductase
MGTAFLFHGWPKAQNPFGWMGPEAPVPAFLQAMAWH